ISLEQSNITTTDAISLERSSITTTYVISLEQSNVTATDETAAIQSWTFESGTENPWMTSCMVALFSTVNKAKPYIEKKYPCSIPKDLVITRQNYYPLADACMAKYDYVEEDGVYAVLLIPPEANHYCKPDVPYFRQVTNEQLVKEAEEAAKDQQNSSVPTIFVCIQGTTGIDQDAYLTITCKIENETELTDEIVMKHCMMRPGWKYSQVDTPKDCVLKNAERENDMMTLSAPYYYVFSCTTFLGLLGNCLTLFAMAKAKPHPSRCYIVCLIITQNVYLLLAFFSSVMGLVSDYMALYTFMLYFCQAMSVLQFVCATLSTFMKVLSSLDRYLAICKPFSYRKFLMQKFSTKIYFGFFVTIVILGLWFTLQGLVLENTKSHVCEFELFSLRKMSEHQKYFIIFGVLVYLLPWLLIVVLSSITSRHLFNHSRARKKFNIRKNVNLADKSGWLNALRVTIHRSEVKATILMFSTILTYLFFSVPLMAAQIWFYTEQSSSVQLKLKVLFGAALLHTIEHSVSLIVYGVVVPQFRMLLKKVLLCR
ncbi:unnamed protein product, partial [Owenia fusiformis]